MFDCEWVDVMLASPQSWADSVWGLLELNEGCKRLRKLTVTFIADQPEEYPFWVAPFFSVALWCGEKHIKLDFAFGVTGLQELDYEVGRFLSSSQQCELVA